MNVERVGEKIKLLRIKMGLTQKDLATVLSINRATLANWEIERSDPDLEMMCRLADFFNVSTDYLLGRIENYADVHILRESEEYHQAVRLLQASGVKEEQWTRLIDLLWQIGQIWEDRVHEE